MWVLTCQHREYFFSANLFIFTLIYSVFQFLFIYLLGGTGIWIHGFVLAADCEVIEGNI
jgi:hypothetical protein